MPPRSSHFGFLSSVTSGGSDPMKLLLHTLRTPSSVIALRTRSGKPLQSRLVERLRKWRDARLLNFGRRIPVRSSAARVRLKKSRRRLILGVMWPESPAEVSLKEMICELASYVTPLKEQCGEVGSDDAEEEMTQLQRVA